MSATFADVAEETQAVLRGWTRHQDQATYLTELLPQTEAEILRVANADRLNGQVVEIDDELIELDQVDRQGSFATIPPYGRGAQGTQVSSHMAGSKVLSDPLFPRFRVKQAINDAVLGFAGDLFDVRKDLIAFDITKQGFSLPEATSGVLDVRWRRRGTSRAWVPVHNWDLYLVADDDDFPTGVQLDILEGGIPHDTSILVTYAVDPVPFAAATDTLADVGLQDSARDVLVYGAVWRLLSNLDGARLSSQTITGRELAERMPVSQQSNLTAQIWRIYQVRLAAERKALLDRYPGRIHRVRR